LAAAISSDGLPLSSLDDLLAMGFTATELGTLVINPRTLRHRRSRNEMLSLDEADRAVRLARIFAQAEEVFGEQSRAWHWMRTPNRALENHVPVMLLQTETGARVVEEALVRIDEGIFA
jgi:putative toxin-antitoxin system antitoxin component (TIGR02293 family)